MSAADVVVRMSSKKPRGSIHKIREFELEKINLVDEFDILQIVGEGWFGKILLVEHRASQTEMVLKAVPKPYVSLRDFYREFHYGVHLGIHRNIVTTYDVAFETAGFYVFTQEYAPLGDLTSNVTDTGVGEVYSKRVAKQIASALDYMHTKEIVHRDVKLDNVLIYRSDFSRVKLCDFGESFQTGTVVERRNEWLPYSPPEVLDIKPEGTYKADPSHDVWQFGIVIFVCLTGCLPWQKAASDDPRYMRYLAWQGTMLLPVRRTPKLFKLLSSRAQRMFRRFLEPRADRRPKSLSDLAKYVDDRWLAKSAEKEMAEYETDELCPSMYSFHSSPDEKHRLLYTLADCGIETNVDRQSKKNRIKDWIESSVITEEDEEENEETNSASPSSSVSREPVRGHISSIRTPIAKSVQNTTIEKTDKKEIMSTIKDAAQKHFDPRTGVLQQGPSEMGANSTYSMGASLVTLSSRQDLIASDLNMYTSDAQLSRLGEPDSYRDRYLNQSLSSGDLLTSFVPPLPPLNPIASPSGGNRSVLQRSKSDSVKAALFASSPAIDFAATPGHGNAPNGSSYFVNGMGATNGNNKQKVTFTGLANAFQTLAQVTLPASATSAAPQTLLPQSQPLSKHYFNRDQNDSQVKDSAYGSFEVSESPGRAPLSSNGIYQPNGGANAFNQPKQMAPSVVSSVRTQQQQQPRRMYTGAATSSSLKDTAYDRTAVNNGGQQPRRILR